MKKFIFTFVVILACSFVQAQKLVILHTNDMHSNLTGYGPEAEYTPLDTNDQDKTIGGFSRLAGFIDKERQQNPDNLLILDGGDFLMGTVFHTLENKTGFQLWLMKMIGYDYVTLGNHEFDMGTDFIANAIKTAKDNNSIPQILSSQLIFDPNDKQDDLLEKLYQENVIKSYDVFIKNGIKIGIFGIIGDNAQFDAVGAKPLKFKDRIKTSKEIVDLLRNKEKCDIIICLSHSGVYPNEQEGYSFEDIQLANKVGDIDIIISGHTHVATKNHITVGKTIIVQTGAYLQNIGRLEVELKDKKLNVVDFRLIAVDDKIQGNSTIQAKIDKYKQNINQEIFAKYNLDYDRPFAEADFELVRSKKNNPQSGNLGWLVADAMNYYTNNNSLATHLTLVANGTIRERIFANKITPADIFRIMPLGRGTNDFYGSSLAQIFINAQEVKKLFEMIIFASKPGEDSYLFWSGAKVEYNPKGGFLNKVKHIYIDHKEIDFSKKNKQLYSITANLYLLSFVGEIKKMSKGLIVINPKDANGKLIDDINKYILDFDKNQQGVQEGKEWMALVEYIRTMDDRDNNGLPNISDKYNNVEKRLVKIEK